MGVHAVLDRTTASIPMLAYHRNCAAFYQIIAAERGVTAEFDGIAVAVTDLPVPYLNLAIVLRTPNDPERALAWTANAFAERSVPWIMYIAEAETAVMAPVATRHGLVSDHTEPGMVLAPLPDDPACPEELSIHRVTTPELLTAYQTVFSAAYEAPRLVSERAFSPEVAAAPGHTMYVGFVDDRPVAIVNRVTSHRIAGICAVGTIPAYRRRGLAAAMVLRAAADGRTEGCLSSYLQSWEMGLGVYRGIGFRPIVTYNNWRATI